MVTSRILRSVWMSMRPRQWIKNLFVFAPLLFVRAFTDTGSIMRVALAFLLFCLASSALYLFNDIVDRERDLAHPVKRYRPIASGALLGTEAFTAGLALATLALSGAFALSVAFGAVLLGYLVLNLLYSLVLKHLVILDVFSVAAGFVLRVVGGAVVIAVPVSVWILFCTFFLTLFLAITKRTSEHALHGGGARTVLRSYSPELLGEMRTVTLTVTLVAYALFTFSSEHSRLLMLTTPIVMYGLFYYLHAAARDGDDPTDIVLSRRPLQVAILLWVLASFAILFFAR